MKKLLLLITLVAGVIALVLPAQANILTFELDYQFSSDGVPPESSTTPWISATFDDSYGGDNTVRLTMSAVNLTGDEFIHAWYFNFDPNLDPTLLTFSESDVADSKPNDILTQVDGYKADGDGWFDIKFYFPPPPGNCNKKFTDDETVVYDIIYPSAINVFSFHYYSTSGGGQGTYLSAAKIQSIGTNDDSGWISPGNGGGGGGEPMPEPTTMLLLGTGLVGLVVSQRKKFRK